MFSIKNIVLVLLATQFSVIHAQEQRVDWKTETEVLERELRERHPNLYFRHDSAVFYSELKQIAESADEESRMEMALRLQQAVARLGDPNTRINYHFLINRKDILPMKLFWFSEGLVVMKCEADSQGLEGRKIVAINNHPLQEIVDSLASLVADTGLSRLKSELPLMLTWIPVLEFFGFLESGMVTVEAEDMSGQRASYRLTPSPNTEEMSGVLPSSLPLSWKQRREYFHGQYLPEDRIYYLQYNKCWSRELEEKYGSGSALFMPSYKEFEKKMMAELKKNRVDKLVLDLRFNDGGKAEQGSRLISKLEKSKVARNAGIYLIIGRDTRDAAIVNAREYITSFQTTVVGESSGGKPNHFNQQRSFVLTASGLVVSCSGATVRLMEEDPPALFPELEVFESFEAYMKGLDPALEAIRSHPRSQD